MKPTMLFISCEHAVNTIPTDYKKLFNHHQSVLSTHRAIDFGALDIGKFLSHSFACEFTSATVSRLLIDCNRSLTHKTCFSEFTDSLTADEKQRLIDKYYLPYRSQTESLIKKHIDLGHQVLHLSTHSFTPVFNGNLRNAGICLLYDTKRHAECEVAREWRSLLKLQSPSYRIRMNYPYKGSSDGFTSALRKCYSEKEYLGFEVEVNQALVKDKTSLMSVANVLKESLQELMLLL